MDTIETNEPVGAEGATSSQDTSSNDTQTAEPSTETTDGVSDADVVEPEAKAEAPLLAGKYKSPEELEKAYKELEGKLGEVGQKAEIANLLERNTGMNAQQIRDYIANQEAQALQQKYQDNPVPYLAQELSQLKGQLAYQNEEKELDKFLSSEDGKTYAPFKDKILKLGLNLEKDKPYEDIAREYFGESRAQGQQDAYRKIDTKRNTQATGASQAAPKGSLTPEDMDKMSAAEMEQVLPWADVSHRL